MYGIKSPNRKTVWFIHDDLDSAIKRAKILAQCINKPVEVHTNAVHPLSASFGVEHYNPVVKITPQIAQASHESKANLSGHGGGDVRTSSCDPEVYPFVLFTKGGHKKPVSVCAVHPEYGHLGRLGATRSEALGRLGQLQNG